MDRICGFCGNVYNIEIYKDGHYCDKSCEYVNLLNKPHIQGEPLSEKETFRLKELSVYRRKELEMYDIYKIN